MNHGTRSPEGVAPNCSILLFLSASRDCLWRVPKEFPPLPIYGASSVLQELESLQPTTHKTLLGCRSTIAAGGGGMAVSPAELFTCLFRGRTGISAQRPASDHHLLPVFCVSSVDCEIGTHSSTDEEASLKPWTLVDILLLILASRLL